MKRLIFKRLLNTVIIVVVLSAAINLVADILTCQHMMEQESHRLFSQIKLLLSESKSDLTSVESSYRETCINNATAVAYILKQNPNALNSVDELNKIATYVEVDEIHIFDKTGTIIFGTVPDYYGYSFDSGEQIAFFAPMLKNKTLKLCQDIQPNTAEGKSMQYAAVWSEDGEMIIQIGNEPVRVIEATKKNELSHILSLLSTDDGVSLYAANKTTREIIGSTDKEAIGKTLSDAGFDEYYITNDPNGFHDVINKKDVFCVFTEFDSFVLGRACTTSSLYEDIPKNIFIICLSAAIIAAFMVYTITTYLNTHIVHAISDINLELKEITEGNLDKKVNVDTTPEFIELSSHINSMVASVLSSTNKISHVLDHTELRIGVYEYNKKMAGVQVTKQLPDILGLDEKEANALFSDYKVFEECLNELRNYPVDNFENTYILSTGDSIKYIRLESIKDGSSVLGILIDETEDFLEYNRVENERDTDILTGLFNRKGLDVRIEKILETPDVLKYSAVIMIDADGLKTINDKYGHNIGDAYLCNIADQIKEISPDTSILSRQGGDEFVLFYYGFNSEEELTEHINKLNNIRDNCFFTTEDNIKITLKFSMGYSLYDSSKGDFGVFLLEADRTMYTDKRERKNKL